MNNYLSPLEDYLPEGAINILLPIIDQYYVQIIVSRPRSTKKGDYWPPRRTDQHKITINSDLNKYAFLFTLVHEIAHLKCWIRYKNKVSSHGTEWKNEFRKLLNVFVNQSIFPKEIEENIVQHIVNKPKFSGNYKLKMECVLEKYNAFRSIRVKDLSINDLFELRSGRQFKIIKKIRTRFLCLDINNNRQYLISSMSEIKYKI